MLYDVKPHPEIPLEVIDAKIAELRRELREGRRLEPWEIPQPPARQGYLARRSA